MEIKILNNKNFITALKEAFYISGLRMTPEQLVMFDNGTIISVSSNDGLLCRWNVIDYVCIEGEDRARQVLFSKRLCDFLSFYVDSSSTIVLEIDSKIKVYVDNVKTITLNLSSLKSNPFECDTTNMKYVFSTNADIKGILDNSCRYIDEVRKMDILKGVSLKLRDVDVRICATDATRLFMSNVKIVDKSDESLDVVVPGRTLRKINKFLNGTVEVYKEHGNIYFKTNRVLLRATLLTGVFPNVEQLINKEQKRQAKINVKTFYDAIQKTSVVRENNFGVTFLTLDKNKLKVFSDDTEFGNAEIVIDCKYNKAPITTAFSSDFLLECLSICENQEIDVFVQETQPLLVDDKTSKILIMPLNRTPKNVTENN